MESLEIHLENVKHGRDVILCICSCISDCLSQHGIFLKVFDFTAFETIGLFWGQGFGMFSKGLEYQIMW